MSEVTHAAPREILRISESSVPTIRESEFVTKWLLTLHEYIRGEDVKIGLWLQEMDINVFGEVSVVDTSNTELYRVPSIFINKDKVLPNSIVQNIGDIMYRAETMNKIMPGKGDHFIQTEITNNVRTQSELPDYQRRWDDIFTRYDLDPVFYISTSSRIDTADDSGDFDDYEEL